MEMFEEPKRPKSIEFRVCILHVMEEKFRISPAHPPDSFRKAQYDTLYNTYTFEPVIWEAAQLVMNLQESIFRDISTSLIESYYKERLEGEFSERDFMEFLCFHTYDSFKEISEDVETPTRGYKSVIKIIESIRKDQKLKKHKMLKLTMDGMNRAAQDIITDGVENNKVKLKKIADRLVQFGMSIKYKFKSKSFESATDLRKISEQDSIPKSSSFPSNFVQTSEGAVGGDCSTKTDVIPTKTSSQCSLISTGDSKPKVSESLSQENPTASENTVTEAAIESSTETLRKQNLSESDISNPVAETVDLDDLDKDLTLF